MMKKRKSLFLFFRRLRNWLDKIEEADGGCQCQNCYRLRLTGRVYRDVLDLRDMPTYDGLSISQWECELSSRLQYATYLEPSMS